MSSLANSLHIQSCAPLYNAILDKFLDNSTNWAHFLVAKQTNTYNVIRKLFLWKQKQSYLLYIYLVECTQQNQILE